jgi:hypothetical protein
VIVATDRLRPVSFRSASEALRWIADHDQRAGYRHTPASVTLPMEPHGAYWLAERTGLALDPADLARIRVIQRRYRALLHHIREVAPGWHTVERIFWADNSVDRVEEDRHGNRRTVQETAPHGDRCY